MARGEQCLLKMTIGHLRAHAPLAERLILLVSTGSDREQVLDKRNNLSRSVVAALERLSFAYGSVCATHCWPVCSDLDAQTGEELTVTLRNCEAFTNLSLLYRHKFNGVAGFSLLISK